MRSPIVSKIQRYEARAASAAPLDHPPTRRRPLAKVLAVRRDCEGVPVHVTSPETAGIDSSQAKPRKTRCPSAMKQPLDGRSRSLVQEFAPLDQQRVVGNVVGQRVLEGVFDISHRRLLVDELA